MHWYKRHIGDIMKKAGRLNMMQHGAFTLLHDSCYDRERFPSSEEEAIEWCWASTSEEIEAVKFVLSKFFFFDEEEDVYANDDIRKNLIKYRERSVVNSRIANERETKRALDSTNRERIVANIAPNQEPRTNNQKPVTNNQEPKQESTSNTLVHPSDAPTQKRFVKPSLEDVQSYIIENEYTVKAGSFWNYYEANGWKVGRVPMKDWKAAVRQWQSKETRSNTTGTLIEGDRDL